MSVQSKLGPPTHSSPTDCGSPPPRIQAGGATLACGRGGGEPRHSGTLYGNPFTRVIQCHHSRANLIYRPLIQWGVQRRPFLCSSSVLFGYGSEGEGRTKEKYKQQSKICKGMKEI